MKKSVTIENQLLILQPNMRNFAYLLTMNKQDAEDLLQDTTLKVLNNKDKFTENVNFKGWVLTIMKNIFINNYHKILRNQMVMEKGDDSNFLNLSLQSSFDSPEISYAVGEISHSINSFPDEYRIPFSMHIEGFKYEEIADTMHLPLGTVKSRISSARKRLQEQLIDYRY